MSEDERQAIIHLIDKQARYEHAKYNNLSFSDEDYEAYIIRQSMINKDNEIEKLKSQLQQKENIIKEVREKIESVQILGLRSGKTLIATLLNDTLEILDKVEENK